MASGRLAAVNVSAGTNTLIYTYSGRASSFVTVNICNRNDYDIIVRLAHVDGVLIDLADEDYIEYDIIIRAGGVLERSEIGMVAGQSIIGYSDKGNTSFTIWG